ncbi:MAG: hypothetical protein Satyrvirus13_13 [Satyrvirus sp.]|uniref:Uncharacterized protein n=1 Tax=Satyrvirus sp. TaxID=2487771 RepID=A0A3G5ADX6_9VIRU|nr:MAG: hypothetical protein Satyrvirus13_13 [Satyrvirus sp.]
MAEGKTEIDQKKLLIRQCLAIGDYYEKNLHARKLVYMPIFFYNLCVTDADKFEIMFESPNTCLKIYKILVLAPNGRVIKNSKKRKIIFSAKNPGTYVIKYWIGHLCEMSALVSYSNKQKGENLYQENLKWTEFRENIADYRAVHDAIFYINIFSKNNLDNTLSVPNSKHKIYSMLGAHKEGSLYKGEGLKEKCQERYMPAKLN